MSAVTSTAVTFQPSQSAAMISLPDPAHATCKRRPAMPSKCLAYHLSVAGNVKYMNKYNCCIYNELKDVEHDDAIAAIAPAKHKVQ
jgi:hypothetical protein